MDKVYLWEHVEKEIPNPIDLAQLVSHKKKKDMVKKILLDYVKDYFIPHISNMNIGKKTFVSLKLSYFIILVLLNRYSCETNFWSFICDLKMTSRPLETQVKNTTSIVQKNLDV